MTLKDWEKIYEKPIEINTIKGKLKGYSIKYQGKNSELHIFLNFDRNYDPVYAVRETGGKWFHENKTLKTKAEAIKYAKAYMRNN